METILPALNEEAPVFQKEVGRQIKTKFTPRVRFVKDESFEYGDKIETILRDISKNSTS
jgi:ribosome-binding factor A